MATQVVVPEPTPEAGERRPPARAELLDEILRDRRSTRAFLPTQVPRARIEQVLRMAEQTPSWCNTQPWQLVITTGAATERFRQALYDHAASHPPEPDFPFPERYEGEFRDRRRDAGWALYRAVGVERGDRSGSARQMMENFRFFGAPHVAVLTTDADLGAYGAVDCGLFLQSLLLAAQSHGIATVPQAALASHAGFIRQYFDLAPNRLIVVGISFGYADPAHPANSFRTSRVDVARDAVRWVDQ